jgi:hypothetical protein
MYNNSNEMVRGYFMRQSEGGYAPKNFKYNQKNNKNKNKSKSKSPSPLKRGSSSKK